MIKTLGNAVAETSGTGFRMLLVIGVAWMMLLTYDQAPRLLPASYWFEVESVHIVDADEGDSRIIVVERLIKRDFDATWHAEVERWNRGGFTLIQSCTANGRNSYSTDNALPNPVTLDWWLFPVQCELPPGQYRLDTTWTLSTGQKVRAVSNTFKISARTEG
jgi:hypothetical protein